MGEHGRVGRAGCAGSLGEVWIVTPRRAGPDELRRRGSDDALATAPVPRGSAGSRGRGDRAEGRTRVGRARRFQSIPWSVERVRHRVCLAAPRAVPHGGSSLARGSAFRWWSSFRRRSCGSRQWGVHRPGWGTCSNGSASTRRCAADVVARLRAGAEQVAAMGWRPLMVITPRRRSQPVDVGPDRDARPAPLGLAAASSSVGSAASASFHALQQAVEAVAGLEGATLLLVGDGPEHARSSDRRARRRVAHGHGRLRRRSPDLAAMDVALVLASPERGSTTRR